MMLSINIWHFGYSNNSFLFWFGLIPLVLVTAMVMLGWSDHLTTLFTWASLSKQFTSTWYRFFRLLLTSTLLESAEGRRMAVEIISPSISMNVWDRAGIELATPGPFFLVSSKYLENQPSYVKIEINT